MKLKDKNVICIGLTGGIASGKSIIARWLEQDGFKVIYSDKTGHSVLSSPEVLRAIRNSFGDSCFKNGNIDRKKLGEIVFSDKNKLSILNSITHPQIRKMIQREINLCENNQRIIIEMPLIFESNLQKHFDSIVLVYADKDLRIRRIAERDGLSFESALSRISSQIEDSYKKKHSDFIIENNNSLKELRIKYIEMLDFINCIKCQSALPFL